MRGVKSLYIRDARTIVLIFADMFSVLSCLLSPLCFLCEVCSWLLRTCPSGFIKVDVSVICDRWSFPHALLRVPQVDYALTVMFVAGYAVIGQYPGNGSVSWGIYLRCCVCLSLVCLPVSICSFCSRTVRRGCWPSFGRLLSRTNI